MTENKLDDDAVASIMTGIPIEDIKREAEKCKEISDAVKNLGLIIVKKSKDKADLLKNISVSICTLLFPLPFQDRARIMLICTETLTSESYNKMEKTIEKVRNGK